MTGRASALTRTYGGEMNVNGPKMKSKWFASQYLDDGRYGVVDGDNYIIIGVSVGLTKEECERVATYHNERL